MQCDQDEVHAQKHIHTKTRRKYVIEYGFHGGFLSVIRIRVGSTLYFFVNFPDFLHCLYYFCNQELLFTKEKNQKKILNQRDEIKTKNGKQRDNRLGENIC